MGKKGLVIFMYPRVSDLPPQHRLTKPQEHRITSKVLFCCHRGKCILTQSNLALTWDLQVWKENRNEREEKGGEKNGKGGMSQEPGALFQQHRRGEVRKLVEKGLAYSTVPEEGNHVFQKLNLSDQWGEPSKKTWAELLNQSCIRYSVEGYLV